MGSSVVRIECVFLCKQFSQIISVTFCTNEKTNVTAHISLWTWIIQIYHAQDVFVHVFPSLFSFSSLLQVSRVKTLNSDNMIKIWPFKWNIEESPSQSI